MCEAEMVRVDTELRDTSPDIDGDVLKEPHAVLLPEEQELPLPDMLVWGDDDAKKEGD